MPGTYWVTGTTASCTATDSINIQLCSGINELRDHDKNVFPNPASEFISIKMSGREITKIEILDLCGKKTVLKEWNENGRIDVSMLRAGMYLIRIEEINGSNYIYKMIKN
jgi:hypothetical protein